MYKNRVVTVQCNLIASWKILFDILTCIFIFLTAINTTYMFKNFIRLEWKSFIRSAAFKTNLIIKIFMGLGILYFAAIFLIVGALLYKGLLKAELDPMPTVSRFMIYYFAIDLAIRYFLQKMPVINIRPLLVLPIKKSTIIHFLLGKTIISPFNFVHLFFIIPFAASMLYFGNSFINTFLWFISFIALIICNNFLNILINNKSVIFYPVATLFITAAVAQYYNYFDITLYLQPIYYSLFGSYFTFVIPIMAGVLLYYSSFSFFKINLNLDSGISQKSEKISTNEYNWLNKFGTLGTFIKNDIRLLTRNKRSRGTIIASVIFLLYGLLFFRGTTGLYDHMVFQIFAAMFVTGGFLFNYGQFVPSWDSSYYQLMMTQNISYKQYLMSKWWLMVIATVVSTIIASFYLFLGFEIYLLIIVLALYNIGVNSHLVLFSGAYVKTPIDLMTSKAMFGDKQSFNLKTLLLTIPKMVLPPLLYYIGDLILNETLGLLLIAITGLLGFALRDKVFAWIERVYQTEKYKTIEAYKQKN